MPESAQMLRQKTSELETALAEVQRELARADVSRRTEAHDALAGTAREARAWLEAHGDATPGDAEAAAGATREAERLLHEMRVGRGRI